MAKLKKRDIKKALKELMFEAAPLSNNKGKLIRNDHCPSKYNSKKRRHDGWVTPRAAKGKYSEMFAEGNEPKLFWDDWADARDGLRYDPDNTHIRPENMSFSKRCRNCRPTCHIYNTCPNRDNPHPIRDKNKKLTEHEKIRLARKEKKGLKSYDAWQDRWEKKEDI